MEVFVFIPIFIEPIVFFFLSIIMGIEEAQSAINADMATEFAKEHTLTVLIIAAIISIVVAWFVARSYRRYCKQGKGMGLVIGYAIILSIAMFLGIEAMYNISLYAVDCFAEYLNFQGILVVILFIPYLAMAVLYLAILVLFVAPPVAISMLVSYLFNEHTAWTLKKSMILGIVCSVALCLIYILLHPQVEFNHCVTRLFMR